MEFGKSQTAVENRAGCRIICGVPTTLAVKGLMMMMMMMMMVMMMTHVSWTLAPACAEYETTNLNRSRRGTEEP